MPLTAMPVMVRKLVVAPARNGLGPATPGYSGQFPVTEVSVQFGSELGKWVASAGKVTGSLPPGSALPSSTSAVAWPPCWPGYHISRIDLTADAHGISTGSPVLSTTTVFGLAAATAWMRSFW